MASILRKAQVGVDYTPIAGKLPRSMVPSDGDMKLEIRGHFLIGEHKQIGEEVSLGQKIMLQREASLPHFTVLVITHTGERGEQGAHLFSPISYRLVTPGKIGPPIPTDLQRFIKHMQKWAKNAEDNPVLTNKDNVPEGFLDED